MSIPLRRAYMALVMFALIMWITGCFVHVFGAEGDTEARVDTLMAQLPELEKRALSTLMFGGSAPVSFSGEARLRLQYHNLFEYPGFMENDRSWLQANWEGNESLVRLGMVVRAGRNTVLWSKIGFQNTLPGNYTNDLALDSASMSARAQTRHDKSAVAAAIHEDMSAGIAIRTVPASFWLKMGNIHWTEASPLTIWKSQPRTFAWEYLPFEIEQPIGRYYEYNSARGEKAGRAAWNKKPLNGINIESISLPGGFYANFLWAAGERYGNFEREYVGFDNDVAYAGETWPRKALGIGDTYHHVLHARVAAADVVGRLTPGLNLVRYDHSDDILVNPIYQNVFGLALKNEGDTVSFFREPLVLSADLRGNVADSLSIHVDAALGFVDTSFFLYDTARGNTIPSSRQERWSDAKPAFYARLDSRYGPPLRLDLAYFHPGYYSPLSMAMPADAFYPFGANLLGPGKFLSRSEGSPYAQNMAGANLVFTPRIPGYGHLRLTYGQHFQVQESRDVIFFPYRLNGMDLFSFYQSSYNRWGNDLLDHSIIGDSRGVRRAERMYHRRLGDESYFFDAYHLDPRGPEAGGLRSDYLGIYEGFVPYGDSLAAAANLASRTGILDRSATHVLNTVDTSGTTIDSDTLFSASAFVPVHRKYTFNLELDGAYDIGPLIGYRRDFFLSLYAALNGVSTALKPAAFNDAAEDMLLWGAYLRFEPAIALAEKFYLIGLAGAEVWRSRKAYMEVFNERGRSVGVQRVPLQFLDVAFGLGFDWEMLERVGLHARFKWMKHDDVNWPSNNWKTPVVSTEIKMWF